MIHRTVLALLVLTTAVSLLFFGIPPAAHAEPTTRGEINFNRDIRPILADRCYHCHGPDGEHRKADLRFDLEEAAKEHALVEGSPDDSEMILRIESDDDEQRMPPPESGKKPISAEEKQLLRRWIEQGAKYEPHWSFVAPRRSAPPQGKLTTWPLGPIDQFVLAEMEKQGLAPSPPADRATLIRRVTFDLTGLPATPEQIRAFEEDAAPDAYEKIVDRLLSGPAFGEKMAVVWLDAARYADTNGYLQNSYRVSWPWRDWLVRAFNDNKSYDRFIAELLAGDLLPDATDATRLATCFLRMHMITSEGGSIDEEFRIEYAADRSETVGTVFLGLTMNCCRCHDHKYDPIPQTEYYQLLAMFADPKGEDPVLDHSRDPAFAPFIRLPVQQFESESSRLDSCLLEAEASKNHAFQQRLTLQKKMLDEGLSVMVMEEAPPKPVYVLNRGAYDAPDEDRPVQRGGIDSVYPWKDELPRNRLGFVDWLTDPSHPLTARVEVNRLWAQFFGRGLVETQEDFGLQGSFPTHPQLLDTLAVEFRESGWDRKKLIRALVTSVTYRQASTFGEPHRTRDPLNKYLARMSRRRLPAEAIRDQALAVAGLLDSTIGGHPVLPYQPAGLWIEGANSPGYGRGSLILTSIYEQSSGAELYRRSLYTFWNRNAPPPQMQLFDAPGRSSSSVSRTTTNTPLQALVAMNDVQFTEAARFLAQNALRDVNLKDDAAKLGDLYRRCTGRKLEPDQAQLLLGGLNHWRARYTSFPEEAAKLLSSSGLLPRDATLDAREHAAWMMIATSLLNLDATLVVD